MSREESVCCRTMHGQCGQMAKMGCCRTAVKTDEAPQIAATSPVIDVHWVCFAHLAPLAAPVHMAASVSFQVPPEYPPPGLLTPKTAVLRI
jgi:hypothetical protein